MWFEQQIFTSDRNVRATACLAVLANKYKLKPGEILVFDREKQDKSIFVMYWSTRGPIMEREQYCDQIIDQERSG